jgi:hypothetical protein
MASTLLAEANETLTWVPPPPVVMVYLAMETVLVLYPAETAMACRVVVLAMTIGLPAEYLAELVVGVEPSVV